MSLRPVTSETYNAVNGWVGRILVGSGLLSSLLGAAGEYNANSQNWAAAAAVGIGGIALTFVGFSHAEETFTTRNTLLYEEECLRELAEFRKAHPQAYAVRMGQEPDSQA